MEEGWERWLPAIKMYAWWLGAALILLGCSYLKWLGVIRSPMERATVGLYTLTGQVLQVMGTPLLTIRYWQQGAARVADLEQRLARAAVDRKLLLDTQTENEQLKLSLGLPLPTKLSTRIVGRLVDGADKSLLALGVGSGIKSGEAVVTLDGVLVGRITSVGRYMSLVLRPQDNQSRIAVRVAGKSTTGIVTGDGSSAKLGDVLQADSLEAGDIITTSGADELYPEGLVVGEVVSVTGAAAEVTKGAQLMLLNKHGNLVYVEVTP